MSIKAVLFDLDGVIADTASHHFSAWRQVSKELNIILADEFEEQLKGVDRVESFKRILNYGKIELSDEETARFLQQKNEIYLQEIAKLTPKDILPGITIFLNELKTNNIKCILASASKNAPFILKKLEIADYFYAIADPSLVKAGKPAPDIFLKAAELSRVDKRQCIGIEDAQAGIDALNLAEIRSVAIGNLTGANLKLESTIELRLETLKHSFS